MHILYLVPHVPNPTKARSYFQIRGLIEAGQHVTVATLIRHATDDNNINALRELGVEVISSKLSSLQTIKNSSLKLVSGVPLQTGFMWSTTLMKQIMENIQNHSPDIIHVEHLRMTPYGLKLVNNYPIIWDAVDFLTPLFEEASHTSTNLAFQVIYRIEAPRLRTYEKWITGQFPQTLVISQHDQLLFQDNNPYADRIKVTLPGLFITKQPISNEKRSDNVVIMTGTLNYHPNVASVKYFVREIWPLIQRQYPNTHLQLVGANPNQSIRSLENEHIQVTGFVPSITDYLKKATVSVAPVLYAAGMQNKILEAFLTATPVVATSIAVRGLDIQHEREVLIADTPEAFATAVMRLLVDQTLREKIGNAGRKYIESNHDLTQTTANLISIYKRVITSVASSKESQSPIIV